MIVWMGLDEQAKVEQGKDGEAPELNLAERLKEVERDWIWRALKLTKNRTAAARALGIPRTTLIYKMKRHGIQHEVKAA